MNSDTPEAEAFARLHPAIQYHVVNSLGWPSLRALQTQAIAPLLAGRHALLIAPTAGGKTEAAFLPILSRMLSEDWRGLSVLYVCPIKALLNNLEPRLSHLAGLVGRRVAVWHGDVTQGEKSRTEADLPDVLLTTPESLEGMLIGSRRDHQRLLGQVRCVIADELHAFAADDRGWHLLALLARIHALGAPPLQRIGLSATVGDPASLLQWFAGYTHEPSCLVQVDAPPTKVDVSIDYVGSIQNAATLISQLHRGEKRLVFCDSRSKVEQLATGLRGLGVDVFVSHAALSADIRAQAERAFAERQNCVIVATSTLELGLDVGDLDRVIQIDAPASVASFLQRLGRTGRRTGSYRNMLFLATEGDTLLEALAIAQLFREGFVEPVAPPPLPFHVVVQQLFAALVERGGEIEESTFLAMLRSVPGLATTLDVAWSAICDYLLQQGYLCRAGSFLSMGPQAEKKFRGKGLADLCVSFETPRTLTVMCANKLIGYIDPLNVSRSADAPTTLSLGGRSWRVQSIEYDRGIVHVVPSDTRGGTSWLGSQRGVSADVSFTVKRLLEASMNVDGATLSRRAVDELARMRDLLQDTLRTWPEPLDSSGHYLWWTYSGLAANLLIAARIRSAGGHCHTITSWSIKFDLPGTTDHAPATWRAVLREPLAWKTVAKPKFADLLPARLINSMTQARVEAEADPAQRRSSASSSQ